MCRLRLRTWESFHSELVYLKIKPIHFPFLSPEAPQNPKINLENQNTFWPTTLPEMRRRRKGASIRMHLNTHTHTAHATDNEVSLFSGRRRHRARRQPIRCRCGYATLTRTSVFPSTAQHSQKVCLSRWIWLACLACSPIETTSLLTRHTQHAWVFVMFNDYVPFATENVVCA